MCQVAFLHFLPPPFCCKSSSSLCSTFSASFNFPFFPFDAIFLISITNALSLLSSEILHGESPPRFILNCSVYSLAQIFNHSYICQRKQMPNITCEGHAYFNQLLMENAIRGGRDVAISWIWCWNPDDCDQCFLFKTAGEGWSRSYAKTAANRPCRQLIALGRETVGLRLKRSISSQLEVEGWRDTLSRLWIPRSFSQGADLNLTPSRSSSVNQWLTSAKRVYGGMSHDPFHSPLKCFTLVVNDALRARRRQTKQVKSSSAASC